MSNREELWLDREIITELLYSIKDGKTISNDLVHVFIHSAMRIINEREPKQIAVEYADFSRYINAFWHREGYSKIRSKRSIFVLGEIVSCTRMLDAFLEKQKENDDLETIKNKSESYLPFLKAIKNQSGIKHKELAVKTEMSPSALSHFVVNNRHLGFFSDMVVGREKYYYLTAKGESVLKQLEVNNANNEAEESTKKDGSLGNHLSAPQLQSSIKQAFDSYLNAYYQKDDFKQDWLVYSELNSSPSLNIDKSLSIHFDLSILNKRASNNELDDWVHTYASNGNRKNYNINVIDDDIKRKVKK